MNTKNNQRFREMDLRMKNAMMNLLREMDFEKITVKKICESAGVNRSTFYAHYIDIYDLMEQTEEQLRLELLSSYTPQEKAASAVFSDWPFVPFLRHIKKHRYFYKIALQYRKSFPLRQGFEPMWEQIVKPRCERAGITDEAEMMYYLVYFQAGFTMVLKRWVDCGCKESEETVTKLLENCVPSVWR